MLKNDSRMKMIKYVTHGFASYGSAVY